MNTPSHALTVYPLEPVILPKDYADYTVTRTQGTQEQTIASCMRHIPVTMAELGSIFVDITKVDPQMHTCMGCLKGWSA